MKSIDDQSVKLKPVNISDMHFKGKPPNLMTVKFSRYTVDNCVLFVHACVRGYPCLVISFQAVLCP